MDLSVIIVNYNVRQFLENALTSVRRAMEGLTGEVFVVDNASDDGSAEMVRTSFPDVQLIENPRNLGFARANNIALSRAKGDFVLILNPDTIVQEDTFQVMLRFFADHPDAGLAGCKILNPDGSFQLPCRRSFPTPWVAFTKIFGLSALFPKSRLFGRYNLTYHSPDETYPVDAVSGSFMMARREVYERIGGLDEAFFMYGEDLDWCYRILQAGYKVYYVHSTQIVHYKGESTKRSEIDEIKLFYRAMQLFVEKHISRSVAVRFVLTLAILFRELLATLGKAVRPAIFAGIDFLLIDCALALSVLIYFGGTYHFPQWALETIYTVPALIVVTTLYASGVHTTHRYSLSRSAGAVVLGFIIISAIVFFAKSFAFSRAAVVVAGALSLVMLPGWRLAARMFGRGGALRGHRKSLFGRRTLIVGTGSSAQEVLRKLRARVDDGYDVLGFIDTTRKRIGERVAGVEIIGSLENVGRVIDERRVSEVIFSVDGLSYADMLSAIARSKNPGVNFRLVPNSLEAIIGKTRIDRLDTLPLVDIDYNIHKPLNRFVKRLFDIAVSVLPFVVFYPFARIRAALRKGEDPGDLTKRVLQLPGVLRGTMSMVGRPMGDSDDLPASESGFPLPSRGAYLGPRGLTGLVQINRREDLTDEEINGYKLYYAKNQSLMLDIEIVAKSLLLLFKKRRNAGHGESRA